MRDNNRQKLQIQNFMKKEWRSEHKKDEERKNYTEGMDEKN